MNNINEMRDSDGTSWDGMSWITDGMSWITDGTSLDGTSWS